MFSLGVFLHAAVQAGTPLLFATVGEIVTEKVGNLNLGVEGLMLMGAVGGFMAGYNTGSPIMALVVAALTAMIGGWIYAFLTVTLRANQVVTGLSITILGTGISGFLGQSLVGEVLPKSFTNVFREISLPLLNKIPLIGPVFFEQNIFVYLGFLTTILLGVYFNFTRYGLNAKTVGENPYAADANGISVSLYKYVHILMGSALCGLGGAYLSLVYIPAWQENITAGRGWIAVALVIFSMWHPYRALIGAFVFGGLDIIGFRLQELNISISQYLIDMFPYIVTILVLIFNSVRKDFNAGPKGLSVSYFREER
jgi:simple sugar transport system permease protein